MNKLIYIKGLVRHKLLGEMAMTKRLVLDNEEEEDFEEEEWDEEESWEEEEW
jgi:hypothetical protein